MSNCTKIIALMLCCSVLIIFFDSYAFAKPSHKKGKNKPVVTTTSEPVEIDEEFKGEFKYFDPEEEKAKEKEQKKIQKIEKKHQKLKNKKDKLEKKAEESQNKIEIYKKYTEDLKNSFLPANSSNPDNE